MIDFLTFYKTSKFDHRLSIYKDCSSHLHIKDNINVLFMINLILKESINKVFFQLQAINEKTQMKKTIRSKSYVTSNNESISNHMGKPHVSFKMLEASKFAESQTVVCSDSTLCHLWTVSSFNPVSPINFDCVVGGTVIDVHKLFCDQYRNFLPLSLT